MIEAGLSSGGSRQRRQKIILAVLCRDLHWSGGGRGMTAPKKPSKRSPQIKSVEAGAGPPILTDAESIFVSTYRAMDDETRESAMKMMQNLARDFPRAQRLFLVAASK